MSIQVPDGYVLTAADYVYMDRADYTYNTVKTLIAETLDTYAAVSDRFVKGRPGIPGTIGELNLRVQILLELKNYAAAARLIERKCRKAYKLGADQ